MHREYLIYDANNTFEISCKIMPIENEVTLNGRGLDTIHVVIDYDQPPAKTKGKIDVEMCATNWK